MEKVWSSLLVAACVAVLNGAYSDDVGEWRAGRGTYYGTDAWSIHQGSCHYGYLFPDEPLGWNVIALPDVHPDYANSCGTCYQIACDPSAFSDNYGQWIDRKSACYDSDSSLVVRVTDTCPCVYPANQYSNKRWCCGDMDHMDISVWAFERLADTKWGVIGIKYRRVPCDYQPDRMAPALSNPTRGQDPPTWEKQVPLRDWPEYWPTAPLVAYSNGFQNGWYDGSYNADSQAGAVKGLGGNGNGLCYWVNPKGAISLQAPDGSFRNHIAVSLWLYMGTDTAIKKGTVVMIGGAPGDCKAIDLSEVQATGFKPMCEFCTDYYWQFEIYFSAFAGYGSNSIINNSNFFKGCGDNTADQLSQIEVRNYGQEGMQLCLDSIQLT